MIRPAVLAASLTHDCGGKFQVAFEDVDKPYTCPACGTTDRISPETMPGLMANFGRTLLEANRRFEVGGRHLAVRLDCHTGVFSPEEPVCG